MSGNTNADLNISVTFRHTESTPALKSYAIEKISHCAKKYISGHADIQIVMFVEKRDHVVEVQLKAKDYEVSCKSITEDLYSAIDKAADTVETQIRKQKDRNRSHKHASAREADFGS